MLWATKIFFQLLSGPKQNRMFKNCILRYFNVHVMRSLLDNNDNDDRVTRFECLVKNVLNFVHPVRRKSNRHHHRPAGRLRNRQQTTTTNRRKNDIFRTTMATRNSGNTRSPEPGWCRASDRAGRSGYASNAHARAMSAVSRTAMRLDLAFLIWIVEQLTRIIFSPFILRSTVFWYHKFASDVNPIKARSRSLDRLNKNYKPKRVGQTHSTTTARQWLYWHFIKWINCCFIYP